MIRNIVFDMGQVLIRFDLNIFLDKVGVTDPADRELLRREVFLSLEWARMDRGSLPDTEAAEIICRRVPERLREAVYKLVTFWDRPILEIPGMCELIEELKARGYGIYLLSNASKAQHRYWPKFPVSRYFDGKLISCDILRVKPMHEIYEHFTGQFGLKPEECLMIGNDDICDCRGAAAAGIDSLYIQTEQSPDPVSELPENCRGILSLAEITKYM